MARTATDAEHGSAASSTDGRTQAPHWKDTAMRNSTIRTWFIIFSSATVAVCLHNGLVLDGVVLMYLVLAALCFILGMVKVWHEASTDFTKHETEVLSLTDGYQAYCHTCIEWIGCVKVTPAAAKVNAMHHTTNRRTR